MFFTIYDILKNMLTKNKILLSITGRTESEWKSKLREIEALKIKEVALFLEFYSPQEKQEIYDALLKSCIKSIPLVHLRHDMKKDELEFLQKNFGTKYFTCHEENFVHHNVEHWKGFYKNIYLEMNFDNFVSRTVKVEKIGGFCVDLAHFKCGMEKLSKDFKYVYDRKDLHTQAGKNLFACNHLNGYNPKTNIDKHTIDAFSDFDYLKNMPQFLFGKYIALETFNSIKEQVEYKKYLETFLAEKLV